VATFRFFLLFGILLAGTPGLAQIISPTEMFGFRPGTNSKLLDREQLLDYYELLARQSDCLKIDTLGQTTDGLPFPLLTISSPQNLANLEALRKIQNNLADPRGTPPTGAKELIARGKLIISVNCSIHPTEIGPTQMAPNLVFQLLKTTPAGQKILDSTIILLLPMHNPDGVKPVVDWFRQHAGTRYEGGPLPLLYHRYSGHDINRDWYSFTQPEIRLTLEKIYRQWFPQIAIDLHQMGYYYARQFIPPYIQPIDPALHPLQLKQLEIIGDTLLQRLTGDGFKGVVNRAFYDAWTPARSFAFYYGGLRLLSETAGCKIAAPIYIDQIKKLPAGLGFEPNISSANHPAPWTGGTWNFSDVVDLQEAVVFRTLQFVASRRQLFLNYFYQICREAINPDQQPAGYAILPGAGPTDAMAAFLANLEFAGVEIHQTPNAIFWENTQLDSGTVIIQTAQPLQIFIKSLLENGAYPKIFQSGSKKLQPGYDITTHYLPLFYGVLCRPLATLPPVLLTKRTLPAPKKNGVPARPESGETELTKIGFPDSLPDRGYWVPYQSNSVMRFLNQLLVAGANVHQIDTEFSRGDRTFARGTLQVLVTENRALIEKIAREHEIELHGFEAPVTEATAKLRLPRVGLYQSWLTPTDEGWTRFLFDEYGLPCQTLHNQEIRKEPLENKYDVLIFPNQTAEQIYHGHSPERVPAEYSGGIGKAGIHNLKIFVEHGGTIIFLNSASELALKYFGIAAKNPTRNLADSEFNIPGAFLALRLNPRHPLAYGCAGEVPVLFCHSPAFQTPAENSIGFYASDSLCLSGLCVGEQKLAQLTGLAEFSQGPGKLILFGFQPQFRAQTFVSFKLLFNAIYYSVAKRN
jgi:hypothetical protein